MSNKRFGAVNNLFNVLRAINASRRSLNISEIATRCDINWVTAKRHAMRLSDEGLVKAEREGCHRYFRKLDCGCSEGEQA